MPVVSCIMTCMETFAVITQHGIERAVRRTEFSDFDEALTFAESTDFHTDGTMCPNVDESLWSASTYEKGIFDAGCANRFAVIVKVTK